MVKEQNQDSLTFSKTRDNHRNVMSLKTIAAYGQRH